MPLSFSASRLRRILTALICSSGFAALSWEVIWQIKSTLALGVSAQGTALTLAVTMGGMSIGGFLMGLFLREGIRVRPLLLYAILECVIGVAGLCLKAGFAAVERMDTSVYNVAPGSAPAVHIAGIAVVLGVPTIFMGATLPLFALMARQFQFSIANLYGLNTVGGAVGVLCAALLFIPLFGVTGAGWAITCVNFAVALIAFALSRSIGAVTVEKARSKKQTQPFSFREPLIVFATGFATLALEVAWFRSFASSFRNTTDVFAIMLATVLVALGFGARYVEYFKRRKAALGPILCLAGILILLMTPVIERLDIVLYKASMGAASAKGSAAAYMSFDSPLSGWSFFLYVVYLLQLFMTIFYVIAPAVFLLGVAFPWIIDNQPTSRRVGMLYALNTVAAIIGSIGAAWILLPYIGFARTAWIAGAVVVAAGLPVTPDRRRVLWAGCGIAALAVAILCKSGIGTSRVQSYYFNNADTPPKVLEYFEGPDATVSVIEYDDGGRRLLIDSSSAAGQPGTKHLMHVEYMPLMGHLPMLLQDDPDNALVICFGTGQTANAVRQDNPRSLDIVDVNPRIFKLAHNFSANQNVLGDPRVHAIVMDGRAYMRRSRKTYDVITLEPMPPNQAGVNALYSKEFYQLARRRLSPHGAIAQWLPYHSVSPYSAASISRTFISVFPNAILWMPQDSKSYDAILIGTKDNNVDLKSVWPGFARRDIKHDIYWRDIQNGMLLDREQLKDYAEYGNEVTDDNQLLAYGKAIYAMMGMGEENFELLKQVNPDIAVPADLKP